MAIKELTALERLKLSLEYSRNKKHQKSLLERIDQFENKPVKVVKKKVIQESFI